MAKLVAQASLLESALLDWTMRFAVWWWVLAWMPGPRISASTASMAALVVIVMLLEAIVAAVLRRWLAALLIFTLGLITPALLTGALWAASWLAPRIGLEFTSAGVWPLLAAVLSARGVVGIARVLAHELARANWQRREQAWTSELAGAHSWLLEQRQNWNASIASQQALIEEQQAWIGQLEQACVWLGEQRGNWQRLAEHHQRALPADPAQADQVNPTGSGHPA